MRLTTKIMLALTGCLLIATGVLCICNPGESLIAISWVLGLLTLLSGIFLILFWRRIHLIFPQSGGILLSSVCRILVGLVFMVKRIVIASALPYIFAMWITIEGINLAIISSNFNVVGYKRWWVMLILGIATAVLGILGLFKPMASGAALTALVGSGIIVGGVFYLLSLSAVKCFVSRFID